MKDTFTPLQIDGAIWVVKNAPDKPYPTAVSMVHNEYERVLYACTKYPTLPQDTAYWQSKIGVPIQEGEVEILGCCEQNCSGLCKEIYSTTYAIPAKQNDDGSWDMAWHKYKRETPNEQRSFKSLLDYLEKNYNLTKK